MAARRRRGRSRRSGPPGRRTRPIASSSCSGHRESSSGRGPFRNAHLGYWIDREHQGRGLTTEAVRLLLAFAFGPLALHRVQAAVMPRNRASCRVLEKAGFRREGLARRYLMIDGKWRDHLIYAITIEESARRRPRRRGS
ncbi:GNAT family N-acetyltransferase [bacterium]|nr:GNAT family N-acetyltransferase [bacterium]